MNCQNCGQEVEDDGEGVLVNKEGQEWCNGQKWKIHVVKDEEIESKKETFSVVIAGGHAVAIFENDRDARDFAFKHAREWMGKSVKTCTGVPFVPKEVNER